MDMSSLLPFPSQVLLPSRLPFAPLSAGPVVLLFPALPCPPALDLRWKGRGSGTARQQTGGWWDMRQEGQWHINRMRIIMPSSKRLSVYLTRMLFDMIKLLDADGNGTIDFLALLNLMKIVYLEEKFKEAFKYYDANGFISTANLQHMMTNTVRKSVTRTVSSRTVLSA
eukprot:Gb_14027 [translate_table: standard]